MLKEGIFLGKRYEILDRIGSGGMADVYKGKDHKLNRYVAIKVLKSDFRSDETFIKKFLSEAQAAAGLMHPNVVNVYDVGQDRGVYYMVMELVEGITLKEYIEKKGSAYASECCQRERLEEPGYLVPVGVSARHIHLTQEHVEALFGPGYLLTKKKELMGGQFASNETVTIVGLKLRAIENVRILGPVSSKSQVEVSATDAIKLGVKAPIRESGNVAGSAPIAVVGPKGAIYLNEGCIIAKRHIHMPPKDAMAAGVHDGDVVSVQAENERGTVFNHVQIRVDDSFTLEMHIDTDEANAAKIATGQTVRIIK